MATMSITIGDNVFIYVRGQLVMKLWLKTHAAALFQLAPAQAVWL